MGNFIEKRMDLLLTATAVPMPLRAEAGGGWPAEQTPNPVTGQWLFERHCQFCHGLDGRGSAPMAKALGIAQQRLDLASLPLAGYPTDRFVAALKEGGVKMPALGRPLSKEETAALIQYLRTTRRAGGKAP